jgi:hypothetical protein
MFPLGVGSLFQALAGFAIILLVSAYLISSFEGEVDVLISHRRLETIGLVLGAAYLIYVIEQFAIALLIK